jgi:hypothetical protein
MKSKAGEKPDSAKLKFELLDPKELKPQVYNPRTITPHDFASLKRSLEQWGLVEPIALQAETKAVIGGHQRLKAALELGISPVPCVLIEISDLEAKALNLALNRISGDWDMAKLIASLEDLKTGGIDLDLTGFDDMELDDMMSEEPEISKIDLQPPPGTLWIFIGVSVNQLGDVQEHIAALEAAGDIVVRTSRD